jgi:hypothetical protein
VHSKRDCFDFYTTRSADPMRPGVGILNDDRLSWSHFQEGAFAVHILLEIGKKHHLGATDFVCLLNTIKLTDSLCRFSIRVGTVIMSNEELELVIYRSLLEKLYICYT